MTIQIIKKECTKCHRILTLDNFSKNSLGKFGHRSQCKECFNEYYHKWHLKNMGRKKEAHKRWYEMNKDKVKEYQSRPEVMENRRQTTRKRYLSNSENILEAHRQWRLDNPDKARAGGRRSDKKKRSSPKARLSDSVSRGIIRSLRNNSKAGRHWESLVNYTIGDLKRHLEKQFESGMTWENYGSRWQIDHKIPVAVFNFETPEDIDFHRCWSLKNLQPLESIQNASKGAMIYRDFQPSLALAVGGL